MLVLEAIRDDGYLCQDIITQTQLEIANHRLKKFNPPPTYSYDDIVQLAAQDHDEYVVEAILDHKGNPKHKSSLFFKLKWKGYDDSESTWEPWSNVSQLALLDSYLASHPDLKG
jgi:hypothetical protein